MDFRTVLTGLNDCRTRGISNFNSIEVASFLSLSIAQVSKYLSRLHQMGFLKRTRHKRGCLSKNGEPCNKGYFYTYEFSKQGEQYLRWMSTGRRVEVARYYKLVDELSSHLPKKVKDEIVSIAMTREQSKYKGSNQSLRAVGNLIHVFPSISKTIKDSIKHNDLLETENKKLNSQTKELESKLKKLENQNGELKDRNETDKKIAERLSIKLAKIILLENEIDFHRNAAHGIINTINGKVIKDLSKTLRLRDFDSGLITIQGISKPYDNDRETAKEHQNKAMEASKELQTLLQQKSDVQCFPIN